MKKKTKQLIIETDDISKEVENYHEQIKLAKIKKPENSVVIGKVYFFPEIVSCIADGNTLEWCLNFKEAERIMRIALYRWLLKQPEEIVVKSKTFNTSNVIKTKDVLKALEKEEPNLKHWKKEKK